MGPLYSACQVQELRRVVFPEGREYFDPTDEQLMNQWNETYWVRRVFVNLLTVDGLRLLRDWTEVRKQKSGLTIK
jgi:hypothetical protein